VLVDFLSLALNTRTYHYESAFNVQTFFANVLMLQDFPHGQLLDTVCCTSFGSARPFWTLAVEWWIYMAFGYLFLKLIHKVTLFRAFIFSLIAVVPIYNLIGGRGNGLLMDWMLGALAYLAFRSLKPYSGSQSIKWILLLAIVICAGERVRMTGMEVYDPIFAFCVTLFILILLFIFNSFLFGRKVRLFFKALAGFSYTLYLIHYTVLDFLSVHFYGSNPWMLFGVGFIFSNVLSFYMAKLSEALFTKALKRWSYQTWEIFRRSM